MKKIDFNENWLFWKQGSGEKHTVTLPHDAQIIEKRGADVSDGGHGYFPGGVYVYEKIFTAPAEWKDKNILAEFEGVYKNCVISLNGKEIGGHKYGYTTFTVDLSGLKFGEENTLMVVADNSKLPNSRWYSGSGIYRPVWLYVREKNHIAYRGVKITPLSVSPAKVKVETRAAAGQIAVEILDGSEVVASGSGSLCEIEIPGGKPWSDETPNLYTCRVTLTDDGTVVDTVLETFGIRMITWSPKGLFVNGKETLLRGGCVHHDNGIWEQPHMTRANGDESAL